jgi:hypothetical protein
MEDGILIPEIDLTENEGVAQEEVNVKPPKLVEFHKVDLSTGERLDVVLIDVNNEVIPEDCKEGWGNLTLFDPIFDFTINGWVDNKPEEEILAHYRELKDWELNKACEQSILAGFTHTIDGVEYQFSYDMQAQTNFGDSRALLNDGVISQVPWTVKQDGKYTRISITKEIMDALTLTILMHKTNYISRYRDELLPRVTNAKTVAEIKAVTWE